MAGMTKSSRPRGLQLEPESQRLVGSHALPHAGALACDPLRSVAIRCGLVEFTLW